MKKVLSITAIVVLVLVFAGGGFLIFRKRVSVPTATPTPKQEGAFIETKMEDRPYVILIPREDGKEFTLEISRIKNAETIEYELVYLSKGLSRGVVGSIDAKGESNISRKLLLGSCSRNVCKYDEGVEEGTLTLRFRNSEGTRKFTSDFHLQSAGEELTSIDGKFKLEGKFTPGTYYITMPTVGLPGEIRGNVLRGPYGVFTSRSKAFKKGNLSLVLDSSPEAPLFYSWQDSSWKESSDGVQIEGGILTAPVEELTTFVVGLGTSAAQ